MRKWNVLDSILGLLIMSMVILPLSVGGILWLLSLDTTQNTDLLTKASSVATIASVVSAVMVYLWRSTLNEISGRRNVSSNIRTALDSVLVILRQNYEKQFILKLDDNKHINQMLDHTVYNSVHASRGFEYFSRETQQQIHTVYHEINEYNLLITRIREIEDSAIPIPLISSMTDRYYKALDSVKADLLDEKEGIPLLIEQLKKEFSWR